VRITEFEPLLQRACEAVSDPHFTTFDGLLVNMFVHNTRVLFTSWLFNIYNRDMVFCKAIDNPLKTSVGCPVGVEFMVNIINTILLFCL